MGKETESRATEKQKEYARSLGVEFPEEVSRVDISTLIDAAVEKRDEERFERLSKLDDRESEAWNQMRAEVLAEIDAEDCRLSEATLSQMIQTLSDKRDLAAVLLTIPWSKIKDFNDLQGLSMDIEYSDDMTLEEVEAVIVRSAQEFLARKGMGVISLESIEELRREMESLRKELESR